MIDSLRSFLNYSRRWIFSKDLFLVCKTNNRIQIKQQIMIQPCTCILPYFSVGCFMVNWLIFLLLFLFYFLDFYLLLSRDKPLSVPAVLRNSFCLYKHLFTCQISFPYKILSIYYVFRPVL